MDSTQNLYVKTLSLAKQNQKGANERFIQFKDRRNQSSSKTSISPSLKNLQTKIFPQRQAFIHLNRVIDKGLNGFTLTEVLAVVAIVGVLSSIALPNYINQLNRTRQSEAAAAITQLQNSIISYADENGEYPDTWANRNEVAAIMTPSGVTSQITLGKWS